MFTDKINEINGTITDDHRHAGAGVHGARVPDGPVAVASAVAADRDGAAGSDRQVPASAGCRPASTTWRRSIPREQGEWFEPAYLDEHRAGAARVTLGDGDVKTQDFKVKS